MRRSSKHRAELDRLPGPDHRRHEAGLEGCATPATSRAGLRQRPSGGGGRRWTRSSNRWRWTVAHRRPHANAGRVRRSGGLGRLPISVHGDHNGSGRHPPCSSSHQRRLVNVRQTATVPGRLRRRVRGASCCAGGRYRRWASLRGRLAVTAHHDGQRGPGAYTNSTSATLASARTTLGALRVQLGGSSFRPAIAQTYFGLAEGARCIRARTRFAARSVGASRSWVVDVCAIVDLVGAPGFTYTNGAQPS